MADKTTKDTEMTDKTTKDTEMTDKTIKCVVLRDFWDATETRVRAGAEIDLPADEAMDGVEAGNLSRVKVAPK